MIICIVKEFEINMFKPNTPSYLELCGKNKNGKNGHFHKQRVTSAKGTKCTLLSGFNTLGLRRGPQGYNLSVF